jgi:hypothetical protein
VCVCVCVYNNDTGSGRGRWCVAFVWWLFVMLYFVMLQGVMCACSTWLDIMNAALLLRIYILCCGCVFSEPCHARYSMYLCHAS